MEININETKSKLENVIITLLLQSFMIISIPLFLESDFLPCSPFTSYNESDFLYFISFVAIGLSIFIIILIQNLYKIMKHQTKVKIQQIKSKKRKKTINKLKSQKHDFSNHLQTLYSMIQLNKKEEAKNYIKSINERLKNIELKEKINIENEFLAPVLLPYKNKAQKNNIKFKCEIDSGIDNISCSFHDLSRIISNLTKNAIEATKNFKGEKLIEITGENKKDKYLLSVYNTGPAIEEKIINELFSLGLSTKGENRGFGLHIVKSLVEEANGKLEVKSKENFGTKFICHFPKN